MKKILTTRNKKCASAAKFSTLFDKIVKTSINIFTSRAPVIMGMKARVSSITPFACKQDDDENMKNNDHTWNREFKLTVAYFVP